MANPLVSVVIPAYNCERFIEQSVQSALSQTMGDLEVIVIDDASTDKTYEILSKLAKQDPRIRLLQNEKNLGVANTRNRAFEEASGEFVALLDSDDIWMSDKLEKQLRFMDEKKCDLCYTAYLFIDENGHATGKVYSVPAVVSFKKMLVENVIGCSTILLKAKVTKRYKMRAEYAHEDYVFWLELLQNGFQTKGIDEPLMEYRILKSSRSGNKYRSAKNRWCVYRKFLQLNFIESTSYFLKYAFSGMKKHSQ